jgi:hypothetical protein
MHDDELTPAQMEELGTLLLAERPTPSPTFAAELDARVAARFAAPRRRREAPAGRARAWTALLQRPFLPAAAVTLAVGLVALVIALDGGGRSQLPDGGSAGLVQRQSTPDASATAPESAATDEAAPAPQRDALAPTAPSADADAGRKVERTASLELGTAPEHVDDVAQSVLGVVARNDGIVDQSSVQSGTTGGEARFELRIPAARLQPALAALSRLPDAHVLARTDDSQDVNQAYVSVRRRLANARAERAGVVRALRNADTEDETLRLRARLDQLEGVIATAERSQRALDRRVDFSRVSVAVHGDASTGAGVPGDDSFTLGDAAHDALRVLEVAAGVVVIAAAALVPVALLAALGWPLARGARRRRREHVLDAA